MYKLTRTITIESELWKKFKMKTDNCSGTIQNMIEQYVYHNKEKDMDTEKQLKHELEIQKARLATLEVELKKKQDEVEKNRQIQSRGKPSSSEIEFRYV